MKLDTEHFVLLFLAVVFGGLVFLAHSEQKLNHEQAMAKAGLIQKIEGGTVIWTKP